MTPAPAPAPSIALTVPRAVPATSPAELLRRARSGDRAALSALLLVHRPRMRSIALRVCRSPADADDAVQEACLLVTLKLSQYRADAPFSTWIHRVTLNASLMVLRQRRRLAARLVGELSVVHEPMDPRAQPDELCQQRRDLRAVSRAAERLSPRLLLTLELRELRGLEGAEVAAQLGVTAEVVKTRVHRARAALAQALAA